MIIGRKETIHAKHNVKQINDKMKGRIKMSEKNNVLNLSVRGIALYPKKENGVKSYAIRLTPKTAQMLDREVAKTFGAMSLNYGKDEETGEYLLNVKSQYDVPVFDAKTGDLLEGVSINHGADVVVSAIVKEYNFKGKHGVTTYLKGFALYENGESQSGTDFKSIIGNVIYG